ncbi:DUF4296 domain-containing protein [Owenweeksia hongkongensis]|uniref:DUF4296 domain-containing protein n=1 Tax=Owenweeksia hongkongensis TaxID=253245 RepID=UPI003A8CF949
MNLTAKLIPIVLFALVSCGNPVEVIVPEGTVSDSMMVKILTDFHLVEGAKVGNKIMGDTIPATVYTAKVYQKYNLTEAEFEKSFRFYTSNPDMMEGIYEKVIENLNKIEATAPRSPVQDDIMREQTTIARPLGEITKKINAQKDSLSNTKKESQEE